MVEATARERVQEAKRLATVAPDQLDAWLGAQRLRDAIVTLADVVLELVEEAN